MRSTLILATIALALCSAERSAAEAICGDVNNSGSVNTSDALAVLRSAVGQPVELLCAPSGGVFTTGQTTCYDADGTEVDCSGSGQDGEAQLGVIRSFTDNGDGTVTDNGTGLMWEKLSDDGSIHDRDDTYTWDEALEGKIAALNAQSFAGYDDWRLPNRFELDSTVNLGAASPSTYSVFHTSCLPACTGVDCSCTRPDRYWSNSTYLGAPAYAWVVYFNVGDTLSGRKTNTYFVRAVRGGL